MTNNTTAANTIDMTEQEIVHITGRVRPAAQARHLQRMLGVACTRRADGSVMVSREAVRRAALTSSGMPIEPAAVEKASEASNGPRWKTPAGAR